MLLKPSRLQGQESNTDWQQTAKTPYFILKTKKNNKKTTITRVVVSMAVNKSAAKRNFWKRQARERLRAKKNEGNDFLLILSPRVGSLTKKQFNEQLLAAIEKVKK